MTNKYYEEYINSCTTIDSLQLVIDGIKQEMEARLSPYKKKMEEENAKNEKLNEKLLSWMTDNNIKTGKYENYSIIRAVRSTPKIVDVQKFLDSLFSDRNIFNKVKKLTCKTKAELEKQLIKVELADKKAAIGLASMLEGVEGVKVNGYEIQQTEYLTIK